MAGHKPYTSFLQRQTNTPRNNRLLQRCHRFQIPGSQPMSSHHNLFFFLQDHLFSRPSCSPVMIKIHLIKILFYIVFLKTLLPGDVSRYATYFIKKSTFLPRKYATLDERLHFFQILTSSSILNGRFCSILRQAAIPIRTDKAPSRLPACCLSRSGPGLRKILSCMIWSAPQ